MKERDLPNNLFPTLEDFIRMELANGSQSQRTTLQAIKNLLLGAGFPSLFEAKVSLTPPQVRTLLSVPILAIASPGAGKAVEIVSSSTRLDFNTTAYTSQVLSITPTSGVARSQINNFILDSIADNFKTVPTSAQNNNVVENSPMFISADADSAVGDSPVDVYILYRIITL